MATINIPNQVFKQLGLVAFEQTADQKLALVSDVPKHLVDVLLITEVGSESIFEASPYLNDFLESAQEFWLNPDGNQLRSGSWIEQVDDQQTALEATALKADGKNILVVEDLGDRYLEQVTQLQSARENLLTNEQLELEVQRRTADIVGREEQIALCLLSAAGYRDQETGTHVRRIGLYAALMAENIGWSPDDVKRIKMAAPMHDIGKIGIPDIVLLKPGKLTEAEFEIMKTHSAIGAEMLSNTGIPMMEMGSEIARFHHERWDGGGYPSGLKATDIPVSARITAIVDIYDALVHKRVYKPAYTEERALEIMSEMAGAHIDPDLFQTFLSLLPEVRKIREAIPEEE